MLYFKNQLGICTEKSRLIKETISPRNTVFVISIKQLQQIKENSPQSVSSFTGQKIPFKLLLRIKCSVGIRYKNYMQP